MQALYLIQWQTKECGIAQCWTGDVYKAARIVDEEWNKGHQSLQVFLISKDGKIEELETHYDRLKGCGAHD